MRRTRPTFGILKLAQNIWKLNIMTCMKFTVCAVMALILWIMPNRLVAEPDLSLSELTKQLDSLEQGGKDIGKTDDVAIQLHRQLEDLRWKSLGGERLFVCIQLARVLRLQGNFSQAELELKSNATAFRLYDEQARHDNKTELSPVPYALYELGKIYQTQAERNGEDIEMAVAFNAKALKQFYRILREYPEHPQKFKPGAELLVCKSSLERQIDAEIPLPGIVIPRQSNSIDDLTPADINRMLEKKKYAEAIPLLQALATEKQDDRRLAGTLLKMALAYAHLGQDEQCLSVIEQMALEYKDASQTSEAMAVCGRILWEKDKKDTALKIYSMFPDVAPLNPNAGSLALFAAQEYYASAKDKNKSLPLCDKIILRCKDSAAVKNTHYFIAGILLREKKYQDAARHFQQFAELEKEDFNKQRSARYLASSCLFNTGNPENSTAAGEILTGILSEPVEDDIKRKSRLLLAAVQENAGLYSEAVKQYDIYRLEYPGDDKLPEIYLKLSLLYCRLKETDKSAGAFEQLVGNYPASSEAVNARFELGKMLYESEDYGRSVKYFQELLTGKNSAKVSQLFWINEHLSQTEASSADLAGSAFAAGQRLLELINSPEINSDPQLKEIRKNSAVCKGILFNTANAAFVAGDYRQSLTYLDQLLSGQEMPSYYDAKILRARICLALKNTKMARQDLSEAAVAALQENRQNEYARVQCMLADTYIEEGDFQKPYMVLKILDSTSTPDTWREYAIFKAALCAGKLKRTHDFAMLKDKYLERYPDGRFLKELEQLK